MIVPWPGDPVWVPDNGRTVRGTVVRVDTRQRVNVELRNGFVARVPLDQVTYRYERGEYGDDVSC